MELEGKAVQEDRKTVHKPRDAELGPPEEQPEGGQCGNLVRDGEELGQSTGLHRPVEAPFQGT